MLIFVLASTLTLAAPAPCTAVQIATVGLSDDDTAQLDAHSRLPLDEPDEAGALPATFNPAERRHE